MLSIVCFAEEIDPPPLGMNMTVIDPAEFPCLSAAVPNIACVEEAAGEGNPEAEYLLGVLYSNGIGVALDFKKAEQWFTKAAEQGFVQAEYKLGDFFVNGGGQLNIREAGEWNRKAAYAGLPQAQYDLGNYYENAIAGFPKDYNAAEKWFRKSAEQGYSPAQCSLGYMYYDGRGVPQDYKEALKWFRKSAQSGDPSGFYALAVAYEAGQGVEKNIPEAKKWYEKASEDDRLFVGAYAQERLGLIYEHQEKNYLEAEKWYSQAARRYRALAQYNVARIYDLGLAGIEKDPNEIGKLVRQAALGGSAEAQYSLGRAHDGHLPQVPQDFEEIYFWMSLSVQNGYAQATEDLKKVAALLSPEQIARVKDRLLNWKQKTVVEQIIEEDPDNADIAPFHAEVIALTDFCLGPPTPDQDCFHHAEEGDARAQYILGVLYDYGIGVEQDYRQAKKWYRAAADRGFVLAQYNISMLCGAGLMSYEESTKWYYKAAKQGLAAVEHVIGRRYYYGAAGLSENPGETEKWFRRAAEQGNSSAQFALGQLYRVGKGVPQDFEKAYFWFSLAGSREDKGFEKNLLERLVEMEIKLHLSPKQIAQIETQVREWTPRD